MTKDEIEVELARRNGSFRLRLENGAVSALWHAFTIASKPTGALSNWLLVATAAIGTFAIPNAERLVTVLGTRGFLTCGLLLVLSTLCGLLAKINEALAHVSLSCEIAAVEGRVKLLESNAAERSELDAIAARVGVTLDRSWNTDRIVREFATALPLGYRRRLNDQGIASRGHYFYAARHTARQIAWTSCQAYGFLSFFIAAFVAAYMTLSG
jgi:hypothetical protein